jgi:hypothetical protein
MVASFYCVIPAQSVPSRRRGAGIRIEHHGEQERTEGDKTRRTGIAAMWMSCGSWSRLLNDHLRVLPSPWCLERETVQGPLSPDDSRTTQAPRSCPLGIGFAGTPGQHAPYSVVLIDVHSAKRIAALQRSSPAVAAQAVVGPTDPYLRGTAASGYRSRPCSGMAGDRRRSGPRPGHRGGTGPPKPACAQCCS